MRHALPLALVLAACGTDPALYTVPEAPPAGPRIAISFPTVALREVSLPGYAASEDIHLRGPDGALIAAGDALWADDPTRAVTADLARHIGQATGATVAAEPWPFFERAAATLEVRIADMLAESDGRFRLTGQYFVAPERGGGRSGQFALEAPIPEPGGPAAIAAARAQTMRDLATLIARDGLR